IWWVYGAPAVWTSAATGSDGADVGSCEETAPPRPFAHGSAPHSTSDGAGPAPPAAVPVRGTDDCRDTWDPGGDLSGHSGAPRAPGDAIYIRYCVPCRTVP